MKWIKRLAVFSLSFVAVVALIGLSSKPKTARATAGPQIFMSRASAARTTGLHMGLSGSYGDDSGISSVGAFPIGGTLSNVNFSVSAAPGAGKSWTVTIQDNGSNTLLTCTISNPATSCSDVSHSATIAAGDLLVAFISTVGTPASANLYVNEQFSPSTSGQTAFLFASAINNWSTTTENHNVYPDNSNPYALESNVAAIIPEAGTFQDLYTGLASAITSGSYALTLRDFTANSTTTLTCSITSSTCNDTTQSVTATANDLMDMAVVPSTPSAAKSGGGGIEFTPTVAGDFDFVEVWGGSSFDAQSTTDYHPINATLSANATESLAQEAAGAMTVTGLSVSIVSAPGGAGKSRTFTLNDGGVATAATCTISNAATTCTWSGSVTVAQGDLLDISDAPSGTPAFTYGSTAIIANANTTPPVAVRIIRLHGHVRLHGNVRFR